MKFKKIITCLIIFTFLSILLFFNNVTAVTMNFKDIEPYDWFYSAVSYNYKKGMILGLNDTTFAPGNKLTRGMIVTILHRIENSEIVSSPNKFPDVSSSQFYYESVKWASANKIVNGYEDGYFRPNKNVSREELVAILRNYANFKNLNIYAYANLNTFTDGNKVSSFAIDSVKWAIANNIITGYTDDNTIRPQGTANRAEAASILLKYCIYLGNTYGNGTYLVGKDIEPGLYKIYLTDYAFATWDRLAGISGEYKDIIQSGFITGDGYLTVKPSDYALKLNGMVIEKIDPNNLTKNIKSEISDDGIYLIGYDLEPGMYKITLQNESFGTWERLSGVSGEYEELIADDFITGDGYLTIESTDYAIDIYGIKLTKIN